MTDCRDRNGLTVAETNRRLRDEYGRAADFPAAERVTDRRLRTTYRAEHQVCQLCGIAPRWGVRLEMHHIIGGTKGRSDERTNLIVLCNKCHRSVQGDPCLLGLILWAKWHTTPEEVDWTRLVILRGAFLPRLIADPYFKAVYRNRSAAEALRNNKATR